MSTPYYQDEHVTLWHGDALEVLRELPDASVDAVVTDPPYGLEFMGREWDSFAPQNTTAQRSNAGGFGAEEGKPWNKARSGTKGVRSTYRCRTCQGWSGTFSEARAKRQKACECETPDYDYAGAPAQTVAFGKWCELWAAECLRVLKPGGHLLAFGGTRTWHRLACAVEDAGFEVRDSIAWLYGSGFPKSLDVSKAIDKAAGAEGTWSPHPKYANRNGSGEGGSTFGQVAGCSGTRHLYTSATPDAERWRGWGTALKPAFEPVVVARKPLTGTVAANVLQHGTGALNIDACRVASSDADKAAINAKHAGMNAGTYERRPGVSLNLSANPMPLKPAEAHVGGRWPTNVLLDDSQAEALDEQSGALHTQNPETRKSRSTAKGATEFGTGESVEYADQPGTGASRFFPTFRYEAKAPSSERPRVNGTAHPTVKPLDLMRWLVRLVTPPGGTVLEPFAGSGTTVEACIVEGFHCIAIEREADYLPLIMQRINRRRDPVAYIKAAGDELGLFDLEGLA